VTTPENQEAILKMFSTLSETTEAILKMAEAMNRSADSILKLTEVLLNPPEQDEPDEHASGYLSG